MREELPPVSLMLRFRACTDLLLGHRSVGLGLRERMLSESHFSGEMLSPVMFGSHKDSAAPLPWDCASLNSD